MQTWPIHTLSCILLTALPLAAQSAPQTTKPTPPTHISIPAEPPNLGKLGTRLTAYHDCTLKPGPCYTADLNRQANLAISFLKRRAAHTHPNEKLALVLDIDETSLSNWPEELRVSFGYLADDWNAWVEKEQGTAIEPTLRLYNEAIAHGVAVFFITGRPESQRKPTEDNLKAAGYTKWEGPVILREDHPAGQLVEVYKSVARQTIVDSGYTIILNVGDQLSDLALKPQAEYSVKLPNPFYFLP